MIRFRCECGRQLQARDDQAGRKVACPSCGEVQTVPDDYDDAVQTADDRHGVRAAPRRARPDRDEGGEEQAVASGKAVASLVLGVLSFFFFLLTAVPAVILALLALRDIKQSRGQTGGKGLAVTGIITGAVGSLLWLGGAAVALVIWQAKERVQVARTKVLSANNLKQLAIATHNYHDVYQALPSTSMRSGLGNQPISWRVALLPFIERNDLYRQYNFNAPWNGPPNTLLQGQMPATYLLPDQPGTASGQTYYQGFAGPGTMLEADKGRLRMTDVTDGLSNTILFVEAADPVVWTEPRDLPFAPNQPLPRLGGHFPGGFHAAFADGSVRFLRQDTPEPTLRGYITRNGGEIVPPP